MFSDRSMLLLLVVALAAGVLMVLWPTLPVQAQSESPDNTTGDEPQPTGKHIIVFSDSDTLPTDYEQRIANRGGKVEDPHPEIGVVVASGLSEEAAESLESDEDVQKVDLDVEIQWLDPRQQPSVDEASAEGTSEGTSAEVEPTSMIAPNTALVYPRQGHLRAINANQAWSAGRLGSRDVTVAILDSGIDYTHLDLAGNVGGGVSRVDLTRSASFVPSDDELIKSSFPGRHPITDLHFHGTLVAATVSSNAIVAAGVTSRVKLMGVKVLGANGSGPVSGVLAGIRHAAKNEADVINLSLGSFFNKKAAPGLVEALNRDINYAHEQGTVIVVSAGNDAHNLNGGLRPVCNVLSSAARSLRIRNRTHYHRRHERSGAGRVRREGP